ncbi:MAG: DUF1579 domain-containing protein [Erythrobacter sp.]|nr:DUF1579 domain-containing protein [Erythrobacter sp.]NCQ63788.1 DUF1579 domain-containing protein [Alphaproteobacteria bacterium]
MQQTAKRKVGGAILAAALAFMLCPAMALAQEPDYDALLAEQKAAMARFASMDGEWRGTVTSTGPMGEIELTQTERVGTMAGGVSRLVEGRGYGPDGTLMFNAVAMITYDPLKDEYVMVSTARGMTARPWFEATEVGFRWGVNSGPMKITYDAVLKGGRWVEVGYTQMGDQPRQKFLEMELERIGDTSWPQEGIVGPQ